MLLPLLPFVFAAHNWTVWLAWFIFLDNLQQAELLPFRGKMLVIPGSFLHVCTGSLFSVMKLCWSCSHSYSLCMWNRRWTSLNTKFIASAAALMTGLSLLWFQGWVCFGSCPLWSRGLRRGCESPSRLPVADAGAWGCRKQLGKDKPAPCRGFLCCSFGPLTGMQKELPCSCGICEALGMARENKGQGWLLDPS